MKTIKPGTTAHRAALFDTATVNVEARTAELSFSSEEPALRSSFFGDKFYEILDHSHGAVRLERLQNGAPLLIDHDNSIRSQPGVIESVSIDSDLVGRAIVRFGKGVADDEIFQKVQDGIIRNVSVGYRIHSVEQGEKLNDIDVLRVTDWEPMEVSLVPVPMDSSIGLGRSADIDKIDLVEIKEEKKMASDEKKHDPVVDMEAERQKIRERAQADEKKRVNEIMTIGKQYAERGGVTLAADAVAEGVTVQEFQSRLLDHLKEQTDKTPFGQGAKVTERIEDDKQAGFKNLGDFCRSVMSACRNTGFDERLKTRAAATSISSTESGPEGGYTIPEAFGTNIVNLALEEDSLLSMIENTPIAGNTMTFPADEGTPWGTTGVQAYWEGEAAAATQSKEIELQEKSLKLKKLRVLVPVTDELLEDSSAMSSYLTNKMSTRLEWKVQDAIVNGSGAGQPLGITQSASYVTQAKETSQTADTIVIGNIAKMDGRLIEGAGARSVWLINPDAYNQLVTLNSTGNLVWTPPSEGFKAAPGGFLLGKPVIKTDTLQTLGDKFDIILANMAGYNGITKAGGVQLATSMHLWFDQGLQAFRLTFRMDGQPMLKAPVTPPNSSVTRGHFVTLAARA